MRFTLFLFSVLLGTFFSFSESGRSHTVLSVKSNEPMPLSLLCEDIDSITFTNIARDGSVCDSVVTECVHTSDSIYCFDLHTVDYTSFEDATDYMTMRDNYTALSQYLTETHSKGDNYEQIVAKISNWLEQQSCVEDWSLLEEELGFEVKYYGGYTGVIYFVSNRFETSKMQTALVSVPEENVEDKYINVASRDGEEILYNNRILCFQGCSDLVMSWFVGVATGAKSEITSYQEILDDSPVAATIYSNDNIGDLNFLIKELPESEMAIITHTHGESDEGKFLISANDYNLKYIKYLKLLRDINPAFLLIFSDNSLDSWHDSPDTFWVSPKAFDDYSSGSGVGLLNYCWSNKFRERVLKGPNAESQKNFAGYSLLSYVDANIMRVKAYLSLLSHGYTHSDAIDKINSISNDFSDKGRFQYDNKCNSRYFSIENIESVARPLDDCYTVKFKIKGWKNLKKEVDKIKIWYKGEPFEHPDESCKVMEFGLTRHYGYDPNVPYWLYLLSPCALGDDLYLNAEGPDFYIEAKLNTILSDSVYYTLGFEFDGRIYHGDVVFVNDVLPEVTPGQCIDMGFPSGTQWAAWNIGATNPSESGGRYGWGEPTGTYTEQGVNAAPGHDNYDEILPHYGGLNPPANISGSSIDIAHVKWGNGWRLPSEAQWSELMNDEYTIWQTYRLDGVRGLRIISKINGNKIFIPIDYSNGLGVGDTSHFWTGQLRPNDERKIYAKSVETGISHLDSKTPLKFISADERWKLLYVRPVKN